MQKQSDKIIDKFQKVSNSVKKNMPLLKKPDIENKNITFKVGYNSRVVLSNNKEFLEALKTELGGEIMEDTRIGQFLYYGDLRS